MARSRPEGIPVELFLDGYSPIQRAIAERLRGLVRRTVPEATESVRSGWRVIGYDLPMGRQSRFFAWVFPEREHVHLGFPHGILIADPQRVMAGEGVTKRARWLTYTTVDQVDEAVAEPLIRAAAGIAELPPRARR